jgi:hypothetical protein
MCGFRVYPLPPTLALIDSANIGKRMDFDSDILVRLAWRNQPMRWLPTQVHYPLDGVSHFRLFHDNALISACTPGCSSACCCAPVILWRRWQHERQQQTLGRPRRARQFLADEIHRVAAKVLGRRLLSPLLYGIAVLLPVRPHRAPQRLAVPAAPGDWSAARIAPDLARVRQFMAFADSLLDKLDVWNGKLRIEQIEIIDPAHCAASCAANAGSWWARTWATSKCAARWRRSAKRSP